MVLVVFMVAIVLGGGTATADFTFGEPMNLGPTINSSSGDGIGCFSADGLEMYLASGRPGGYGNWDIWVARRSTIDDDWGEPLNLGPLVNGPQTDACASISFDGLELYFNSTRPGGYGDNDLYVCFRSKEGNWSDPVNMGAKVNTAKYDAIPYLSYDNKYLFFCRNKNIYWVSANFIEDLRPKIF